MLKTNAESVGRSQRRRVWIVASVTVIAALVGALLVAMNRGVSWRSEFAISYAELAEPNLLWLGVGTCNENPEIGTVEESDEAVKVAIVSTRTFGGPGSSDCMDIVHVELSAPLGDRTVIDLSSGKELAIGNR